MHIFLSLINGAITCIPRTCIKVNFFIVYYLYMFCLYTYLLLPVCLCTGVLEMSLRWKGVLRQETLRSPGLSFVSRVCQTPMISHLPSFILPLVFQQFCPGWLPPMFPRPICLCAQRGPALLPRHTRSLIPFSAHKALALWMGHLRSGCKIHLEKESRLHI